MRGVHRNTPLLCKHGEKISDRCLSKLPESTGQNIRSLLLGIFSLSLLYAILYAKVRGFPVHHIELDFNTFYFILISLENLLPHLNSESRCIISDDSSGFMHINLHPQSQRLCGIHLGDEEYVFNSMPFGLTTGNL